MMTTKTKTAVRTTTDVKAAAGALLTLAGIAGTTVAIQNLGMVHVWDTLWLLLPLGVAVLVSAAADVRAGRDI